MTQKLAFEGHIVHISESSSNEHIKQDWCESRWNYFNIKYLEPIFYTPTKLAPTSL